MKNTAAVIGKAVNFILNHPEFSAVLILVLFIVIIVIAIVNSLMRKKIFNLTPYKPGKILVVKDGNSWSDYIVVHPKAKLISLETGESFKVYEVLDKVLGDVGAELAKFYYSGPFGIKLKISNLKRKSDGYSIIVSDKNGTLYELKTKFLPENYTVTIQDDSSGSSGNEDSDK